MQIQLKVVLLTGLAVICAVGLLAWRASGVVRDETSRIMGETAARQLSPVRRLVRSRLETSREQLIAFARAKERGLSQPSFGDFDVVGLAFETDAKSWSAKWIDKRPDAKASRWAGDKDAVLVRSLPFSKVKDGEMHWVWRLDKKEGALFAVMVPVQVEPPRPAVAGGLPDATTTAAAGGPRRAVVVGFFGENPLAGVSEDFIGSINSVYVLDELGYVASHTTKSYNGTRFSEDELYKAIKGTGRSSGVGDFESLESQRVVGRWEKVERTNLYAAITTPVAAIGSPARTLMFQLAILGAVATALAIGAAWLAGGRFASALRAVQRFVLEWKAGNFQTGFLDVARFDEIGDVSRALAQLDPGLGSIGGPDDAKPPTVVPAAPAAAAPGDAEAAYRQMAVGLTSSMRDPIATILGNVQLLAGKAVGADFGEHAVAIEREARRLRGVLESLMRVAGDDEIKLKPVAPLETVELAIAALDREIGQSGVELELRLGDAPRINASPLRLQAAIEALLRQGIEAMRTRPGKRLAVTLSATPEGRARLTIRDTGLGLDREQVARYFEPFHQPYEGASAPDLSLAMARATFERHLADVVVDSSPGQGTSVSVEFPPTARLRETKPAVGAAETTVAPPPPGPSPELSLNPLLPQVDARVGAAPPAREFDQTPPAREPVVQPPPIPEAPPLPVDSSPRADSDGGLNPAFLGGKAPLSPESPFPPSPEGGDSAPLDLSRTAPPKSGEPVEVAMPSIEIPSDVEVVIPTSPGKILQMPNRANSAEPSELGPADSEANGMGDGTFAARLFFEEPAEGSGPIVNFSTEEPVPVPGPQAPETQAPEDPISFSMDGASEGGASDAVPAVQPPPKPEIDGFSFSSVTINLEMDPPAPTGPGLLNIDVPSSFLDDEPDSFRPVALGAAAGSGGGGAEPAPGSPPSGGASRPATDETAARTPQTGATGGDDGLGAGFRVKIRRPKTKG